MKKSFVIILFFSNFYSFLFAQTATKDVDKLYQKYKTTESVNVTNAKVSIDFSISINLNQKEKPESVILTGYTGQQNIWDAESIVNKLGNDKLKAGYKYSGTNTFTIFVDGYLETITVKVYTKGSQYAKYGISNTIPKNNTSTFNLEETEAEKERRQKLAIQDLNRSFKGYFIYLEVGDISRKSNGQSSDFTF